MSSIFNILVLSWLLFATPGLAQTASIPTDSAQARAANAVNTVLHQQAPRDERIAALHYLQKAADRGDQEAYSAFRRLVDSSTFIEDLSSPTAAQLADSEVLAMQMQLAASFPYATIVVHELFNGKAADDFEETAKKILDDTDTLVKLQGPLVLIYAAALLSEDEALKSIVLKQLIDAHERTKLRTIIGDPEAFTYVYKSRLLEQQVVMRALRQHFVDPATQGTIGRRASQEEISLREMERNFREQLNESGIADAIIGLQRGLGDLLLRAYVSALYALETKDQPQAEAILTSLERLSLAVGRIVMSSRYFFYANSFTYVFADKTSTLYYLMILINALPSHHEARINAEAMLHELTKTDAEQTLLPPTTREAVQWLVPAESFRTRRVQDARTPIQLQLPNVYVEEVAAVNEVVAAAREAATRLNRVSAGRAFNIELMGAHPVK